MLLYKEMWLYEETPLCDKFKVLSSSIFRYLIQILQLSVCVSGDSGDFTHLRN